MASWRAVAASRIELLGRAKGGLQRSLSSVAADQWGWATACGTWTVADLVSHVIGATHMYIALLDGASAQEAVPLASVSFAADDAVAEFADAADALETRLAAPNVLTRGDVRHPAGDVSGDGLLGYAMVEWVVHGWDLARAIGVDDSIDPDLALVLYDEIRPVAGRLSALGAFAPAIPMSPDTAVAERLLRLLGRCP